MLDVYIDDSFVICCLVMCYLYVALCQRWLSLRRWSSRSPTIQKVFLVVSMYVNIRHKVLRWMNEACCI